MAQISGAWGAITSMVTNVQREHERHPGRLRHEVEKPLVSTALEPPMTTRYSRFLPNLPRQHLGAGHAGDHRGTVPVDHERGGHVSSLPT